MKVKGKLSFFDTLFLWINILLCLALLISYLAPFVDPKKIWVIAFFGLAYPLLLLGNILFIVFWLLRKKWLVLLPIICIAIGYNMLLNNFELHGPSSISYGNKTVIHMMTYNVHNFKRYGSKNDISTKHEILQIITEQHPDIIGFQEFYTRKAGQYDMRDSILKIMGTTYYYFEPVIANSQEAIGLAIFSRYPITAHGLVTLANKLSENACLYVDVTVGSKQLRVYSVHLQSIKFDPDDYKYLNGIAKSQQSTTDKSSVRRMGSKLKAAFIKRSDQVVKIKEHAEQCPYPFIISGDFNDTPSSYAVNQMAKGLKNAFREDGSGFGRTYNGDFPNYQIDYILTSPIFGIANYHIIEKKLSDHYPVSADLLLN
ncbi:endonuclease/exonuclease/phosphatase family protein [Mucilaginibacter sp.]|uniref:endonuclease/exonuclease/phosphatase family protein n=1 Tax=Mucilaginibacter sp. TaxID=1882438 RepID=UPI003D09A5DF